MYLRSMAAVLARCETDHRFWHNAQMVWGRDGKARLRTYWRNPELAGVWQLEYGVSGACFDGLLQRHLLRDLGENDVGERVFAVVK